jgi:hypothetical protein
LRNSKNGRLLAKRSRARNRSDFVQMEAVSIPPKNHRIPKIRGHTKKITTPYTPRSTGVVELANHTIMERIQSMLDTAGLSKKYWAIAASEAVNLTNRTPT